MNRFAIIKKYAKNFGDEIAEILLDEHPQILAVVLSYLDKTTFNYIVKKINKDLMVEIYFRMLNLKKVNSEILDILENHFENKFKRFENFEIIDNTYQNVTEKFVELDDDKIMKLLNSIKNAEFKNKIIDIIKQKKPDIVI